MRFRFGWCKEQKRENLIMGALDDDRPESPESAAFIDTEPNHAFPLDDQAPQETTRARILVFGDHEESGNLCTLFLRSKGYEVYHFPSPATCALTVRDVCTCPREHVCADILITEMDLEGMTGIDLVRHQRERGCRALPEHKAVISERFTNRQEYEARELGCKTLGKPFRLLDLMGWVRMCESGIPSGRRLTPPDELLVAENTIREEPKSR